MTIISIKFLLFLFFSILIYYFFPRKYKWIILLITSIIFIYISSSINVLPYMLATIIWTYVGTIIFSTRKCKSKGIVYFFTLLGILVPLTLIKYINIIPVTMGYFIRLFSLNIGTKTLNLVGPLGISYYSLSMISYITDVYWGKIKPEKNFLKYMLYACYYPVLISGPILRYSEVSDELYNKEKFNISNVYIGFTRIVYGLMKKVVIADSLYRVVNTVFSNYEVYSGSYIIFGVICYAIQIYCDFSGCMDIVIGASKCYNINISENFNSPFFSKTLSEFWRRWHISLGTWGKDYIMYPLLKTDTFQNIGKKFKRVFGKKIGKKIPTILSILILWLLIGLWHGTSYKYIFAAGILPWMYLTISEFFEPIFKYVIKKFKINTDCFSYKLFQTIRTFLLMCFVWLVVCSPALSKFPDVLRNMVALNIITDINSIAKLPYTVIVICLGIVVFVDYINYKGINVSDWFRKQNITFRYFILLLMIGIIIIYGSYGPGYNPVEFIYGGF